ncbi:MAG: enoyl-CoA hydratase-related protein [Spirochaetales bacterium]|uniref:Enoyl-CoA hydratase domain-containing protein 3, mitochondrial n=1 Tax=Candidatus Thalassospirochaeta sargassi TaxID=3119039 RepID=A0AAJ1MNS5_9SPIO|nr:enoyl-CoA hydratase-related protein [Spirochaetales bacterium]
MTYTTIKTESIDENIAVIILNRPEALNTFNTTLAEELWDALVSANSDKAVRVIMIKGEGRAFCAGIDVKELEGKSGLDYERWIKRMERPLHGISSLSKPVIAMHHGVAAANGMGLVASSDLVISADTARMGLTAINVGLNCIGPVIPVSRCIGRKRALELLFTGRLLNAEEAMAMGLVNKVVPEAKLETDALNWARELAAKSPVAMRIAKTAFYTAEDMSYDKQFAYMNEAFARLCSTEDAKEGVRAFFEKRDPDWNGR